MGFVKLLPLLTTVVMVLGLPRKEELNYRLPDIYRPADYQVHLNLTADVFTESFSGYTGTVAINFTVTEDTREVKLHASKDDLQIQMVSISGIYLDVLDYNIENVTNILTINYPIGLVAGRYDVLSIQFSGNLSYDEDGFYKSTYKTDSGETRYLATTQFETASARRAFPCFDEPAFKATFDIYITYPVGYTAISNTPGTIVDSESASETIQFETTPVMSTYLLAFVISDFTAAKAVADDEVVHQLWSRNNTSNNRAWGLEMGQKMLAALNRFTGFNYSNVMKKMDQGAIPDFAAGAMENWGLVLYREGALLWNEDSSSNTEKQNVATTIAHEFSHQWFGDLVTMRWWSETFLNEGFATYCEFNVAHEVLPDYKLDEQFLVYVVHSVLLLDSYESEQALESEASTPEEVGQKFGVVSYNKGASIIRMVEHIMGTDNFRAGVHTYIENSKFDNAVPDDLWSALNQHVDNSLSDLPDELPVVMENWTVKSGLPLVHVSRSYSEITITQERLLLSGNDTSRKWYVPISYTTSEDEDKFTNTLPSGWLTPDSDLTITVPETASWVILNNKQTGYYRVNYDDDLWDSIAAGLLKEDFDGITELNRAQIVDDIFNLAMAEKN
ncbi:hypothetical protein NQ318_013850 [Aromia moschata]|uniref:Aminopeptidase n=1 Tax=Aromia moschata TaxID=1265417 RepID=A0AAV8ZAC6_9CUCU|nr:hypothetical protein NQ318_013850 [Aromia moschata]